jgi:hypothetical protein
LRKPDDTTKPPRKQRPHRRVVSAPSPPVSRPKSPAEPETLPFDDPRWLPIGEAHRLVTARLGHRRLAAIDLMDALTDGRVRCLRRSLVSGERSLAPASLWSGYELQSWSDGLHVCPRRTPADGTGTRLIIPVRGWVFYVWRPDFERRWPAAKAPDGPPPNERVATGRKPGPHPTRDWPRAVAAEVIRRIRAGEPIPSVREAIEYCEKLPGGYSPGLKEMQGLLKDLLSRPS